MNEQKYTYRVQWLVLIGAALLLLLLFGAWISEGLNKEWRKIKKSMPDLLSEKSTGEDNRSNEFERGIFQLELPHFRRTDRCISCHHGLEDPHMETAIPSPIPCIPDLSSGPSGAGLWVYHLSWGTAGALSTEDAYGQLPETHWPYPLLEQPYIQASCGKCHLAIFSDEESEGTDPEEPGRAWKFS